MHDLLVLWSEFQSTLISRWPDVLKATGQHVYLALVSIVLGILISVPLGILLTRYRRLAGPIIGITSIFQTIPSLALLGFMVPFLGIGNVPAITAMTIYALLPILRNTYVGILEVDKSVLEAARGMGMTKGQMMFLVEVPLARGVIFAGIRTATVMTIGVATLAAFIGAGGLGDLIIRGLVSVDPGIMLAGAIPAALLAILFDLLFAWMDWLVTPKGLRLNKAK